MLEACEVAAIMAAELSAVLADEVAALTSQAGKMWL